jgi:RNase P subunit RPR2
MNIQCKNCEEIWIPPPHTRVKKEENLTDSSTAILSASFVCSECGALSHYKAEEVLMAIPQKQDRLRADDATTLLHISFQCGHKDCGARIIVHIVRDRTVGVDERASLLNYVNSCHVSKSCPTGHSPTLLNSKDGEISVFDKLTWQYYESSYLEDATKTG